ncbi:MAG TPA: NBR1-Ig-like domain-containing protein [Anaerolineales bacterium]
MKLSNIQIILLAVIVFLAMLACLPIALIGLDTVPSRAQATQNAQATQLAATLQAYMTQIAVTPTALPATPTATSLPPTPAPTFTATPVTFCNQIQFVGDVSFPDGSVLTPGETFTKIWRLKNTGTCAWTTDTRLVFINGAQMGGPSVAALPGYVGPGQTVDISVSLIAPSLPGHYTGYWLLRAPDGTQYGSGPRAQNAFFVDINVRDELQHGTVTGSFCYPSEFNPPLILYFENATTAELTQFSIPENHMTFSVLLPNGVYYAYAWAPNYNLEGAYVNNSDRSMKTLVVRGGQTTDGIAICDWDTVHHRRGQ